MPRSTYQRRFHRFQVIKEAPEQHSMLKQEPPNKRFRPVASSCSIQLFHLLEKDIVFEMNMLMQIGLKSFQILVEDPVGCAGIHRRCKLSCHASDLCHDIPCMLMLAHHLLQLYLQLAELSFCRAFTALFFSGNSFYDRKRIMLLLLQVFQKFPDERMKRLLDL